MQNLPPGQKRAFRVGAVAADLRYWLLILPALIAVGLFAIFVLLIVF